MEQHFKINGATSAVKSVNTVCAKIHSDVRLSNISVHPITSNLLQWKYKNNKNLTTFWFQSGKYKGLMEEVYSLMFLEVIKGIKFSHLASMMLLLLFSAFYHLV